MASCERLRRTHARHARSRPVYYTEWNTSSTLGDPLHDEPYAAAFVASTVMEANGLVEGYSFWTFSDIFAENLFPFSAFSRWVWLAQFAWHSETDVSRVFELLHDLGDRQSLVDGLHETVDCSVIQKDSSVTVLLTNHTTPGHSIETEQIEIRLDNAPEPIATHNTAHRCRTCKSETSCGEEMGQPEYLSQKDVERLEEASELISEKQSVSFADGAVILQAEFAGARRRGNNSRIQTQGLRDESIGAIADR